MVVVVGLYIAGGTAAILEKWSLKDSLVPGLNIIGGMDGGVAAVLEEGSINDEFSNLLLLTWIIGTKYSWPK